MASELYVGVKIGAVALASLGSVMSGAKNTLTGLDRAADDLSARHLRMRSYEPGAGTSYAQPRHDASTI